MVYPILIFCKENHSIRINLTTVPKLQKIKKLLVYISVESIIVGPSFLLLVDQYIIWRRPLTQQKRLKIVC